MSLDSLPLEILEKILQHLLFPIDYSGYYFRTENESQWFQQDALCLAAVNKKIRSKLVGNLWEHISIQVGEYVLTDLPQGCRLLSSNKGHEDWSPRYVTNCVWKNEKPISYYNLDPPTFSSLASSFFKSRPAKSALPSCLTYVKSLRIDTAGITNSVHTIRGRGDSMKKYAFALGFISPTRMPHLEELQLDVLFSLEVTQANQELGGALNKYPQNAVKMILHLQSMLDLGKVEDFGFFPFINEIVIKGNRTYNLSLSSQKVELDIKDKIPNIEKITMDPVPGESSLPLVQTDTQPGPSTVLSQYLGLFKVSNLRYLNLGSHTGAPDNADWLPPTVEVLRCSPFYLQAARDEEKEFARFDNVKYLTIVTTPSNIFPTTKLYFRKLIELYIDRKEAGTIGVYMKIPFIGELVKLFEINRKTLTTFGADCLGPEDISLLEPYFNTLQSLEYSSPPQIESSIDDEEHLLIRLLQKCGSPLKEIRCQVGPVQSPIDPSTMIGSFIDYLTLRDLILNNCPNVKYNLSFIFPVRMDPYQAHQVPVESYFKNFKESSDSKHFSVSDFCFPAYPEQLLLISATYRSYKRRYIDSATCQLVIDFEMLRSLIKEHGF